MLPERFTAKFVVLPTGCWEWTAARTANGYGRFWWSGRLHLAHRVSFEVLVGAIAPGMQIDHLCRNRACVNPSHMEQVTPSENTKRGLMGTLSPLRVGHCKRGHELLGSNLYVNPRGERQCRECINEASARYRERRRQEAA